MDRKLDYSSSKDEKLLGWPFWGGALFGVDFYESDLKYINQIKNHRLYRVVSGASYDMRMNLIRFSDTQVLQWTFSRIIFFEQFLNDPACPPRVKSFLYFLIGNWRTDVDFSGQTELFNHRRPLIEKWMEKCR